MFGEREQEAEKKKLEEDKAIGVQEEIDNSLEINTLLAAL